MHSLTAYLKNKLTFEIKYIISLFLITRIVLTIIGVLSRKLLEPFHGSQYVWVYSQHLWLDIWGQFDTGWYLNIAYNWYSTHLSSIEGTLNQANYGFFPLYPALMKLVGLFILDKNYYLAGIIISNIFLIIASIFLYKLINYEFDNETALKSVKYLYLFPTAFILSGVLTQSLYLLLIILCFYYAKRENWLAVGISGFFLSLTRYTGVLVIIPLAYEYLKSTDFKIKNIKTNISSLILIPLGVFVFFSYCYYLTGDFLAYIHSHQTGWGNYFVNPLKTLYLAVLSNNMNNQFSAYFSIASLLLLFIFYKKIGFSYFLFGTYTILIPLSVIGGFASMERFISVIFPLFIILSKLSKNHYIDLILTVFLALLQGCLMVFWSNGFPLII